MGQLLTAPQSQGAAPRGAGDTRTEDPGPRPSPDPRAASKPKDAPALCFQSYSIFLRSHYLPVCQDEVSEAREALAGVTCDVAHPTSSAPFLAKVRHERLEAKSCWGGGCPR